MKAQIASYIIKYIECGEEGHEGEKVNLICLNTECHEKSLICSLCTPKHRGHHYKPIKIYLDQLYKKYQYGNPSHQHHLQELQKRKFLLLHNLRICVQKLSQQFMHLQEDILSTYQKIKSQIQQNEVRRSRFEQFYLSMIKDNYGDPHFQVKNYLFKEEISLLTEQNIFQDILKSVEKEMQNIRGQFISDSKPTKVNIPMKVEENSIANYLLPKSIIMEGDTFYQTNEAINTPNICLFNLDISEWIAKMKVVILALPLGSKVTLGLIKLEQYVKSNNFFKDGLDCMYVDSTGKGKGVQYNHLGIMTVNYSVDCVMKKNYFKFLCKNNNASMKLYDKNYCFFFALQGKCKIKVTYPSNK